MSTVTAQWTARTHPGTPGWVRVPKGLTGREIEAWVEESLAGLRSQWGSEWNEDVRPACADLLRGAASARPDDKILDLLYWPFPRPIVVRVNVGIHPSLPVSTWVNEGFEVDGFETARLGPAVRCIALGDIEVEGQPRTLITSQFVFDDGTHQVQVEVAPTPVELYSHVAFEVVNLVATLDVHGSDGQPFEPLPVAGYTMAGVDSFEASHEF